MRRSFRLCLAGLIALAIVLSPGVIAWLTQSSVPGATGTLAVAWVVSGVAAMALAVCAYVALRRR